MRITIFGATGKVGSIITAEALRRGHEVVAFVHRKHNFEDNPLLSVYQGDAYNTGQVSKAIKGSDAVISALSSWGTPSKDVLSSAMVSAIPAMKKHKVKRIISLTGADARAPGDSLGIVHRLSHFGISIVGGKVLKDGENHIKLLASSDLDWTVIRSPVMNEKGNPFHFELTNIRPKPWQTINRHSVALAMIQQLEDDTCLHAAPFIARAN